MTRQPPSYHGYRFPPEIISHAVWLYHRFCLSFRDAEDLLAQRGITVTYETIRHWCQTFGPAYARRLRRRRGRMGALLHECLARVWRLGPDFPGDTHGGHTTGMQSKVHPTYKLGFPFCLPGTRRCYTRAPVAAGFLIADHPAPCIPEP